MSQQPPEGDSPEPTPVDGQPSAPVDALAELAELEGTPESQPSSDLRKSRKSSPRGEGDDDLDTLEDELDAAASREEDDLDDDDLDDDDLDDDPDSQARPGDPPPLSRSLGARLLMVGLALWSVWGVLRLARGPASDIPRAAVLADEDDAKPSTEQEPRPLPGVAEAATEAVKAAEDERPNPPETAADTDGAEAERSPEVPEGEKIAYTPRNPNWAKGLEPPKKVTYEIKRGGSIKTVANLYKIFHHEIQELNPNTELDKELPPGTKVLVYRRTQGEHSESVGLPAHGTLEGAVPMLDGPGRVIKHTPWKGWAAWETVALLDKVLVAWAKLETGQPILVGNMSARAGGRLKPHASHQSGRDFDLGYPQNWDKKEELNWREMNEDNLNPALTWKLVELFNATGAVEVIYMDTKLQKILHDWAKETDRVPAKDLSKWLEYPRGPGNAPQAVIQHAKGHSDHIHVRLSCPPSHARCQSK